MKANYTRITVESDGYNYHFYGSDVSRYDEQMIAYAQMAKRFMNKPFNSPLDIVGNYDWHQEFPYEEHLFKHLDKPVVAGSLVIDFGCGPGRMVERITKYFGEAVHGIDISEYAIDYARNQFPDSRFFVSSGIDVGAVPENTYDVLYSTIAIQHIPVKTIRENLFRAFYNTLKPGGFICIQMAYNANQQAGVWSPDTEHASYDSDFWNAKATNGHADCVLNAESMPRFEEDFGKIFNNVKVELVDVAAKYGNLNGKYHAPYWASDWVFISGTK